MGGNKTNNGPAGKSYQIGNVGAHARVQQGEYLTMIEQTFPATPEGEELTRMFTELMKSIAADQDLDDDSRQLAIEKTQGVAEALADAQAAPGQLKRAVLDAKNWLMSAASGTWETLKGILNSDAALKSIETIVEAGMRGAIKSLVGMP